MPSYPSNYYNGSLLNSNTTQNNIVWRREVKDRVNFTLSTTVGQTPEYSQTTTNYQTLLEDTAFAFYSCMAEMSNLTRIVPSLGGIFRVMQPVGCATGSAIGGSPYTVATVNNGVDHTIDGQFMSTISSSTTALRLLVYNTGAAATWNGVYRLTGSTGVSTFVRDYDLDAVGEVIYGSLWATVNGTTNTGKQFYLTSDNRTTAVTFGTTQLGFTQYTPIDSTEPGLPGLGTVMLISGTEQAFISNAHTGSLIYMKNKALRLAHKISVFGQNVGYPWMSSTASGLSGVVGSNNVGYSTGNDLPANNTLPSSFNRGWK